MHYVIIVVVISLIVVPLFSILPSARQRQQMKMRQTARAAGVSVDLVTIDDPNPDQDKYISHSGQRIPPRLQVMGYRIQRRPDPGWRVLHEIQWCLKRELDGSWHWVLKGPQLSPELINFIDASKGLLPEDMIKVEESSYGIIIYWHERTAGTEDDVLNFLQKCAELPPWDLTLGDLEER